VSKVKIQIMMNPALPMLDAVVLPNGKSLSRGEIGMVSPTDWKKVENLVDNGEPLLVITDKPLKQVEEEYSSDEEE
tara:strand:- start:325 stop:552 length:228 start_codon:yes stop_codon:yes gene_type:complete